MRNASHPANPGAALAHRTGACAPHGPNSHADSDQSSNPQAAKNAGTQASSGQSTSPDTAAIARQVRDRLSGRGMPLLLVGMMGVGKSTVGRKLAQQLHLPFTDADDAIVEAAQMPIPEIFDTYGEAYFRDGERRVIARLLGMGASVIATGGGAFVQAETRALILERGIAIWLDADTETLVERVRRKDTRPLLRGGDPREIIARLAAERRPFYAEAPIHILSDTGPHARTVDRIIEALDSWL